MLLRRSGGRNPGGYRKDEKVQLQKKRVQLVRARPNLCSSDHIDGEVKNIQVPQKLNIQTSPKPSLLTCQAREGQSALSLSRSCPEGITSGVLSIERDFHGAVLIAGWKVALWTGRVGPGSIGLYADPFGQERVFIYFL